MRAWQLVAGLVALFFPCAAAAESIPVIPPFRGYGVVCNSPKAIFAMHESWPADYKDLERTLKGISTPSDWCIKGFLSPSKKRSLTSEGTLMELSRAIVQDSPNEWRPGIIGDYTGAAYVALRMVHAKSYRSEAECSRGPKRFILVPAMLFVGTPKS